MKKTDLVFVYGTLRKGGPFSRAMEGSEFIGKGTTAGKMFVDRYPVVVDGDENVVGELYRLSSDRQLASLDRIEGHPSFYKREVRPVEVDGEKHDAWIYMRKIESLSAHAAEVKDNDFANEIRLELA